MCSRCTSRKYGRIGRFHCHHLHPRIMLLQGGTYTANGSTGTDTGYKNINNTFRIPPDFLSRSTFVHGRVCRVTKLLKNYRTRSSSFQFFSTDYGTLHTIGTRCKHQFGTKGFQQVTAFYTHGVGHRKNQFITFCSSYKCKPDSGVSTGRFYNSGSGVQ